MTAPGTLHQISPAPAPVGNVKGSIVNANANPTEEADPIEGQININTAPVPVLATLPMCENATTNQRIAQAIVAYRNQNGPFNTIWDLNKVDAFRQNPGTYHSDDFDPKTSLKTNRDGDLSPDTAATHTPALVAPFTQDLVLNDFESQYLALTRISNLITTRSDTYTVYVAVQGWRHAGTNKAELVVQRRAAYLTDRTTLSDTNKTLPVTNVPVN